MNENLSLPAKLCLASHSPRRCSLLESLGVPFFVRAAQADTEESVLSQGRGLEAELVALDRARVKGRAVVSELEEDGLSDCTVLSADTVVHLETEMLDKPADVDQAMDFLRRLSGRSHGVVTALWLRHRGQEHTRWCRTWVKFADLDEELMRAYVETGDPFDKAGGYGIQGLGGALVERVDGCYFNVMGFPLNEASKLFTDLGISWALRRVTNPEAE